jgi:hypothetical protein
MLSTLHDASISTLDEKESEPKQTETLGKKKSKPEPNKKRLEFSCAEIREKFQSHCLERTKRELGCGKNGLRRFYQAYLQWESKEPTRPSFYLEWYRPNVENALGKRVKKVMYFFKPRTPTTTTTTTINEDSHASEQAQAQLQEAQGTGENDNDES